VYAHQVTDQLQRSRERLVTTREEERRRLRRDLHDGLGPQLATLTIKVSAARNLIEQDGEAAARLLAEVESESQNAIKEIRRVVDGLRPSSLDQLGLVSALQEFVAQRGDGRTRITFSAPSEMPPLPAAVEVAAYRIVTEAVTNVLRHAQAATCVVELSVADGLRLEVRDDGKGISAGETTGVGLASMRERSEELSGQFLLESSPTGGTRVRVDLPL
jgi:signal transduction histidine kinase